MKVISLSQVLYLITLIIWIPPLAVSVNYEHWIVGYYFVVHCLKRNSLLCCLPTEWLRYPLHSVCVTVCPIGVCNWRTKGRRKFKFGAHTWHGKCQHNLFRKVKVKVMRLRNCTTCAINDKRRVTRSYVLYSMADILPTESDLVTSKVEVTRSRDVADNFKRFTQNILIWCNSCPWDL